MPAIVVAAVVAGGAQLGASALQSRANSRATKAQASSTDRATAAQTKATDDALAFEREQEARRREEYDREQDAARAQWDAEQARKAPYRELAESLLRRRAARVGLSMGAAASPQTSYRPSAPGNTLGSLVGRTEIGQTPGRRPMLTPSQLSDLVRSRRSY